MGSATISAEQDFSTVFLSLYEEMKRRFRERGMHATIQTLEKCQSMLLVFLEKGRPMRPYEVVDALLFNPAFSQCKDARRMVFYIMEKLLEVELIERVKINGRDGYYQIAETPIEIPPRPKTKKISQITDPRVKPLLARWKKIFELRNIIKLWNIPSLAHAIVYELTSLLQYIWKLEEDSNEEGQARLKEVKADISLLIEAYAEYGSGGTLPENENKVFHACGERIQEFSKRIWWTANC